MAQNSLQIKSKSRHCENEWCKADISDLHGNAKHCDQRCWEIHQAIDYDKKWVRKLTWKKEYAKRFLEDNPTFLMFMENERRIIMRRAGSKTRQIPFHYLVDSMRIFYNFHFPNPIQKHLLEAFAKYWPGSMEYIK